MRNFTKNPFNSLSSKSDKPADEEEVLRTTVKRHAADMKNQQDIEGGRRQVMALANSMAFGGRYRYVDAAAVAEIESEIQQILIGTATQIHGRVNYAVQRLQEDAKEHTKQQKHLADQESWSSHELGSLVDESNHLVEDVTVHEEGLRVLVTNKYEGSYPVAQLVHRKDFYWIVITLFSLVEIALNFTAIQSLERLPGFLILPIAVTIGLLGVASAHFMGKILNT